MKFFSVSSNPLVMAGPSKKVYQFYRDINSPVEVEDERDIEWALRFTKTIGGFPPMLQTLEEKKESLEPPKPIMFYELVPVDSGRMFDEEVGMSVVSETLEQERVKNEFLETLVEENDFMITFNSDVLNFSIRKVCEKVQEFMESTVFDISIEDKKKIVLDICTLDQRKTLLPSVEEVLEKF